MILNLTPEEKQRDADNRAALLRQYPHYHDRMMFYVDRFPVWDKEANHWKTVTQTVCIISFKPERDKDTREDDHGQTSMFGAGL